MLFKLSNLNSNLALTLGYLNPALNNSARVGKHFVIFLNFPCLIACLLCCLLMSFFLVVLWLGFCVEVGVDRITILPPPHFFSLPTILCLTQVTVI